jgi:hypothetical protein
VPGYALNKLTNLGVRELAQHAAPQIVIVVEKPDFRTDLALRETGTQVFGDKSHFAGLGPQARRHQAFLIRIHFVLYRDRVHGYAGRGMDSRNFRRYSA